MMKYVDEKKQCSWYLQPFLSSESISVIKRYTNFGRHIQKLKQQSTELEIYPTRENFE